MNSTYSQLFLFWLLLPSALVSGQGSSNNDCALVESPGALLDTSEYLLPVDITELNVHGYTTRVTYVEGPSDSPVKVKISGFSEEPLVALEDGVISIERAICKLNETSDPTESPTESPTSSATQKNTFEVWLVTMLLSISLGFSMPSGQRMLFVALLLLGVMTTSFVRADEEECKPVLELEITVPAAPAIDCPFNNVVDGRCLDAAQVTNLAYQAIFVDSDPEAIQKYVATDYIQHNPNVDNGVDPILGLAGLVSSSGIVFDTYRIFADGDTAVTHNVVDNAFPFGAEKFVVIDIFRTANGQVVEHWDNIMPFPTDPNDSGRSVIDGPVMIKHLGETETNRQIVTDFVGEVFTNSNVAAAPMYISNTTYYQHNPNLGDGLDTFMQTFEGILVNGTIAYDVKFVFAQGNYVLVGAEGYIGAPGEELDAFYDLFRLEDGMIVEHWDIIEHIPPLENFANGNGKW